MAMATKNFYGEIDGETIQGLYRYLDKSADTVAERIQKVNDLLYKDEGHTQLKEILISVFDDDRIKISPNSNDSILSDTNVCLLLEACGTYILFAEDKDEVLGYPEEEKIVIKQPIKMDREEKATISLDALNDKLDMGTRNVLEVEPNQRNYKKEIKQVIRESDYNDSEIGETLTCYKGLLDSIKRKIRSIKAGEYQDENQFFGAKRMLGILMSQRNEVSYDMLQVKDQIKKTIYFKAITPEGIVDNEEWFDLDNYDYWDKSLTRLLALVHKPRTDYGKKYYTKFVEAYETLLDTGEIDVRGKMVIDSFREGVEVPRIATMIDVNYQNAYAYLSRLLLQIQRQMIEDYEINEYYLDLVKGDWKKCSKCGESYPRNQYYWNKEKKGKDGFRSECKKCSVKRVKKQ